LLIIGIYENRSSICEAPRLPAYRQAAKAGLAGHVPAEQKKGIECPFESARKFHPLSLYSRSSQKSKSPKEKGNEGHCKNDKPHSHNQRKENSQNRFSSGDGVTFSQPNDRQDQKIDSPDGASDKRNDGKEITAEGIGDSTKRCLKPFLIPSDNHETNMRHDASKKERENDGQGNENDQEGHINTGNNT